VLGVAKQFNRFNLLLAGAGFLIYGAF